MAGKKITALTESTSPVGTSWIVSVIGGFTRKVKIQNLIAAIPVVSTLARGLCPTLPNDATKFLDGTGAYDTVKDADLVTSDVTTNNVTTSKHGFVPKAPGDTSKFLNGNGAWSTPAGGGGGVDDVDVSFTDNTTGDATASQHGFLPKLSGNASEYLDGTGAFTTPAGGGGSGPDEYLGAISFAGETTKEITTIGDGSHVQLQIRFADVKFSNDNVAFYVKIKTAGGVESTNYFWGNFRWTDGGTGNTGAASDTKFQIGDAIGNDTNETFSGNLVVESPQLGTWKKVSGQLNWTSFNPNQFGSVFSGSWHGTDVITGFEFSVSAGTMDSGTVQIWGRKAA